MAELVERTRMDMSHLLKAEANISALPSSDLLALVKPPQSVASLTTALQQGELFYCSDYPQCPYIVYFRGTHYINPAAQVAASPGAIENFRARYPFVAFSDHEPPARVQHGALTRQYYTAPVIAPAPSAFTSNGMFEQPETTLRKDVWLKLFFYQIDVNHQKQPVEGLPYEIKWGTDGATLMSGSTPADGCLEWQGDSYHRNYRVYYGEPKQGQYPFFDLLSLNQDETILLHWVGIKLEDETGEPIEGQDYWIKTPDGAEHRGTTSAEGTAHVNRIGSIEECGICFPDISGVLKDGKTAPPASKETVGNYIIQQGDTLTRIALKNGLNSAEDIYNHPANKTFKDKRPNPNVIYPGDQITLPEASATPFAGSVDKTHQFVLKPPKETFEVIIKNDEGEVWTGKRAVLTVGEQTLDQTLDDSGLLSVELHKLNEKEATLEIYLDEESEEPSHTMEIQLAHLDPIDTISGVQGRCNNLGFDCGAVDGEMGPLTQEGIKAFQQHHQLDVDGKLGPKTQDTLQQAYGF